MSLNSYGLSRKYDPEYYVPSRRELQEEFTELYEQCKAEIENYEPEAPEAAAAGPSGQAEREGARGSLFENYSPACIQVMAYYPEFGRDFYLLERIGYLERNGDKLKWNKTKKSLAEYFGNQKSPAKWADIENLFDVKDLKHSYNKNGDAYDKKKSKDYEEWEKIKKSQGL
jgi:hypothetical protein